MKETIVVIDLPAIIEKMRFRKAIEALGTYQSEEEYLDAMIAKTERDMAEDPDFLQ